MENQLAIILVVGIFVVTYLFFYLFFVSKQKKQELKVVSLLEERESLKEQLESSLVDTAEETKSSKSTLVFEQTKKIESLENEVSKQKRRIKELKLIAQSATMAQQDFLSNVTEELTAPVHYISKTSTTLKESTKESATAQVAQNILNASQKLLVILHDIVDLSKIQAKTFEVVENVADINYILSKLIESKQRVAEKKSLKLTLEVDEKLPGFLMIDASKVENILENLIDNAIRFTQDGYVKVNIIVENSYVASNTVDVAFYVEDTGAGISQEFQDKVFDAFVKVDKEENQASQTVGLGLAIDKKVAQLMKGDITFKSETNTGSIFRFILRGVEVPLWSSQDIESDENIDFSIIRENAKIMLVAQYNQNYETIVNAFQESKVTFFDYLDFRDAVGTLKQENIDLIFIDVEILNIDDGAVSKVIASTTKAFIVPLVQGRVKEVDAFTFMLTPSGYLKKPISKTELFKLSLRLLNS